MVKRSNWSIPYLVFMLVFVVLPLLLIVLYAFQDSAGHFTFSNITHFFSDSDSLSTFAVSIEVAIENTLICILLGYPAAWILANRKYNRSAVTVVLFLMPMWINALMRTLATAELFNMLGIALGKGTLLIDCHSFSSQPNLLCSNPPDIDICIGFNDDATCPNKVVIGNIKQHFNSCGYKVAINTPFSNSKTFEVPVEYHSVMIEVNKCLYINEQTLEKTDGFDQLKADIQSLYEKLLYYGNSSASNPPAAL